MKHLFFFSFFCIAAQTTIAMTVKTPTKTITIIEEFNEIEALLGTEKNIASQFHAYCSWVKKDKHMPPYFMMRVHALMREVLNSSLEQNVKEKTIAFITKLKKKKPFGWHTALKVGGSSILGLITTAALIHAYRKKNSTKETDGTPPQDLALSRRLLIEQQKNENLTEMSYVNAKKAITLMTRALETKESILSYADTIKANAIQARKHATKAGTNNAEAIAKKVEEIAKTIDVEAANLIAGLPAPEPKKPLSFTYDGQERTVTDDSYFDIDRAAAALLFYQDASNEEKLEIPYASITKELFGFIPDKIIEKDDRLKDCFDKVVREAKEISLINGEKIKVYNDTEIFFTNQTMLLFERKKPDPIVIKYTNISDELKRYLQQKGEAEQTSENIHEQFLKWEALTGLLCKCEVCLKRPYPGEEELKAILDKNDRTVRKGTIIRPGPYQASMPQWRCTCTTPPTVLFVSQNCPTCTRWICGACSQLHYKEEQSCDCLEGQVCTCGTEKCEETLVERHIKLRRIWQCNVCNYKNAQCEADSPKPKRNYGCCEGSLESGIECKNIFFKSSIAVGLWECKKCKHLNKSLDPRCQAKVKMTSGQILMCREPDPNLPTFSLTRQIQPELRAEYELYRSKGGYNLYDLTYIDPAKHTIVDATAPIDQLIDIDTYIQISAADYQNSIGDGLCGYRSVTGEFQTDSDDADASWNLMGGRSRPISWMQSPAHQSNLLKRDIITLSPVGFTKTHLIYKAHPQGSQKYSGADRIEHHPIIVMKACQANIHFARLLPRYPDDPNYYYEKATITLSQGKRAVAWEQINRPATR